MGCWLRGFFEVEGLDMRICWGFCGCGSGKRPGAKAPCSLRKGSNKGGEQATARGKGRSRFLRCAAE
jgi:hypothetical protein